MKFKFVLFISVIIIITCFTILAGCTEPRDPTTAPNTAIEKIVAWFTEPTGPTTAPTISPTTAPTTAPTRAPTTAPTRAPTTAPTPNPVTKTVLFSDDLSQWRSGWESEYDGPSGKVFYSGNSLHIRDDKPPEGSLYHKLNRDFDNFILEVDTKIVAGSIDNWQGVNLRVQDNNNYYGFHISADGYYEIQKWVNGQITQLSGPTQSSYVKTGIGATNRLHCEMNKNVLSFSINGNHLKTVTDNTFTTGKISLAANSLPSNSFTEVEFSKLVITTV